MGSKKDQVVYRGDHPMWVTRDMRVPMRDGVKLALDVYRPPTDEPLPALLAVGPYGKELQALSLTLPPQARPSPLWDGCIEAGDIQRIVEAGYVHVIADSRGTGSSGGQLNGNYGTGGVGSGKDVYDLVEWIASQDWCDGNVGMVGISYYASVQILGAAENPPHLKAIFCNGGHYDFYETTYHGGVMWFMPRAAREGRGGDSGIAVGEITSRMLTEIDSTELEERRIKRLHDPDVAAWPNLVHVLHYPKSRELWFDIIMNPVDGPFYEEGQPLSMADRIEIPTYMQVRWGRGWTVDGTIETFQRLRGPKKLDLQPLPPMQQRPFHEDHDAMLRWYDYWLKGIDNGIMDEPAINIHVEGSSTWRQVQQWPLEEAKWKSLYLRPQGRLSDRSEPLSADFAAPDGFFQSPRTVSSKIESLTWSTPRLQDDVEMVGTGAAHLFVEIDTDDTNFILKLYDVDKTGSSQLITSGYLKASHRALDEENSTAGSPRHHHRRPEPVVPGTIVEYVVRLYPFANVFRAGHTIELVLSCNEPMQDSHSALLPPESFHLPSGRATMHKIYRDAAHPSRLVMPIMSSEDPEMEDQENWLPI